MATTDPGPLRPLGGVEAATTARLAQQAQAREPARPAPKPEPAVAVSGSEALDPGPAPPVDQSRVTEIRKALEDGKYPLLPTTVADTIIAARLVLSVQE